MSLCCTTLAVLQTPLNSRSVLSDTAISADQRYDYGVFEQNFGEKGVKAIIPSRKNRTVPRDYDRHLDKERPLIECFFGKMEYFRKVFSRFNKTATSYMTFVFRAATFICLR